MARVFISYARTDAERPELAELELGRRPFAVRPLPQDALPSVIEEPARLAGIGIEDGLVDDTEGGEALPLLAAQRRAR